mmetsp:Transcript_8638/g.19529  ORF Transcript_8638/g.19529 Transcript_8638/m.19529 type:complete len:125 (+) Transcript_8638:73-447(+)
MELDLPSGPFTMMPMAFRRDMVKLGDVIEGPSKDRRPENTGIRRDTLVCPSSQRRMKNETVCPSAGNIRWNEPAGQSYQFSRANTVFLPDLSPLRPNSRHVASARGVALAVPVDLSPGLMVTYR